MEKKNNMDVKLVSVTDSVLQVGETGEFVTRKLSYEDLIVYIARVSNPSNQMNTETSDRLLKYLIKNKHWSPFEMVDMCVEIVTSRGIAQQILRHRSFSFQEFSQRYAEATDFEPIQLRKQAEKNRQSSTEEFDPIVHEKAISTEHLGMKGFLVRNHKASKMIEDHLDNSKWLYNQLLEAGVAKECARFILPLTTQTKIYMKGSVRSWIHYLDIRTDEHTQLEHRQIALKIKEIFMGIFPNISKALWEN